MHLFACKRLVSTQDNAEPQIEQEESSARSGYIHKRQREKEKAYTCSCKPLVSLERETGFEPATLSLEG